MGVSKHTVASKHGSFLSLLSLNPIFSDMFKSDELGTGQVVWCLEKCHAKINDLIHMAGTYRSTLVLNKVHVSFFSSDYFSEITTRANKHLLAKFMLVLEIEFERALQFHDEGYESGDDHDLPKLLIRSTHIYLVSSTVEISFNPSYAWSKTILNL